MTTMIDKAIELDVPVSVAYDQWTQFEDFPLFMDGVEGITQSTDDRLSWRVRRRGVEREFSARITEQHPDLRIAWTAHGDDDPEHHGVVTFHYLDEGRSRIMLQLRFEPSGFLEHYADKVGLIERWVERNLESFKAFIEQRGKPTGAWRGRIEHDHVSSSHGSHDPNGGGHGAVSTDGSDATMAGDRTTPRETASSGATPSDREVIDKRTGPHERRTADKHDAIDHRADAR